MRCFLGIKPDAAGLDSLLNLIADISGTLTQETNHCLRWQTRNQLHLTLAFLGNATESQIDALSAKIPPLVKSTASFELAGLATTLLPSHRKPKCWVLELDSPPALQELHSATVDLCKSVGLAMEKRRYRPHITLARLQNNLHLPPAVNIGTDFSLPVVSVCLFSSRTTPDGSEYRIEKTFNLMTDNQRTTL